MFQGHFIKISTVVPDCFKDISRIFNQNFQGISKMFHIVWQSWQLPEQKEGLLALQVRHWPHKYFFRSVCVEIRNKIF